MNDNKQPKFPPLGSPEYKAQAREQARKHMQSMVRPDPERNPHPLNSPAYMEHAYALARRAAAENAERADEIAQTHAANAERDRAFRERVIAEGAQTRARIESGGVDYAEFHRATMVMKRGNRFVVLVGTIADREYSVAVFKWRILVLSGWVTKNRAVDETWALRPSMRAYVRTNAKGNLELTEVIETYRAAVRRDRDEYAKDYEFGWEAYPYNTKRDNDDAK